MLGVKARHSLFITVCSILSISGSLFGSRLAAAEIQDSITLTGQLFSDPLHLGLSETNGKPGVSLTADFEFNEKFFIGASGYYSENAPSPQRSKGYVLYGGVHWGNTTLYDLALIHRVYPGSFDIDWDFTELQFNAHFTSQFTATLTGSTDYYGVNGIDSLALSADYTYNFSQKIFGKAELGAVHLNGSDNNGTEVDSYQYAAIGGGYLFDRVSVEALYRINNAKPSVAFSEGQIDNALVVTLNWLIY